jgi:hypothetical protein
MSPIPNVSATETADLRDVYARIGARHFSRGWMYLKFILKIFPRWF